MTNLRISNECLVDFLGISKGQFKDIYIRLGQYFVDTMEHAVLGEDVAKGKFENYVLQKFVLSILPIIWAFSRS